MGGGRGDLQGERGDLQRVIRDDFFFDLLECTPSVSIHKSLDFFATTLTICFIQNIM